MKPKRILLAGLFHETNTFAPGSMGLDSFGVARGAEMLTRKGDGSPLGAFLEEAERFGWEVVPTIDLRATPGAMPTPEVSELFLRELAQATCSMDANSVDAIFLVLHGAMASPGMPDVEGEVLRRLRGNPAFATTPIFGVLDLHANYTPAMAEHSNGLLVYRENPHTDAAETGVRASHLMEKVLREGLSLRTRFFATDVLWTPPGTATAAAPMKTLEALARSEERDGIEEINVFAGFAHADTPHTGVSFSIVYDVNRVSEERINAVGAKLCAAVEAEKHLGLPDEWDLDAAIEDALAKDLFPTCIVEPADNIGGGAPGDGTAILRALLKYRQAGSGVILNDPETVAALQGAVEGSVHSLNLGGKTFSLDPGPVPVTARLVRLTDGDYTLEDRHSHAASMSGIHMKMGPCALLDVEGIIVLVTSLRSAPMDLGQWRSQGVDPATLRFIGVKAAVAHRQAYDRISKASYWVGTPGPCTNHLRSLPFKLIRRPVFPLDS